MGSSIHGIMQLSPATARQPGGQVLYRLYSKNAMFFEKIIKGLPAVVFYACSSCRVVLGIQKDRAPARIPGADHVLGVLVADVHLPPRLADLSFDLVLGLALPRSQDPDKQPARSVKDAPVRLLDAHIVRHAMEVDVVVALRERTGVHVGAVSQWADVEVK